MSSSEDDEDMFYDAQDGTEAEVSFPTAFESSLSPLVRIRIAKEKSPKITAHEARENFTALDGRSRTLSSLFGDAGLPKQASMGQDAIKPARQATDEDILSNMEAFSALSSNYRSTTSPPPGDHTAPILSTSNPEPFSNKKAENAAIMSLKDPTSKSPSVSSRSESSHSTSGGSGSNRKAVWRNIKHIFKRPNGPGGSPGADKSVAGSVKVNSPLKHHDYHEKEYVGLRLVQSFAAHTGACWAMKLSHDGKYIATAGQDTYISVWLVSQFIDEPTGGVVAGLEGVTRNIAEFFREGSEIDPGTARASPDPAYRIERVVDDSTPIQLYRDHVGDVIDLSWSKSNFLLSASLDQTVRLWHVSRPDCLVVCRHPDVVSGVCFHPTNDRFFLTGSLDKKLRMWDLESGTPMVSAWAQAPDMISSVCFYDNGAMAVAGLINGLVFLYDANNKMKYYTQILCRNRSGKHKHGCKVSSVLFLSNASPQLGGGAIASARSEVYQLLVSTNDSRIRLFRLNDFSLRSKFKGHSTETNLPIRPAMSECGEYVLSGSDQGEVFIWQKSLGRRKIRTTDAYNQTGEHEAYISNLRTGLSILRNSAFESFDNNVELSPDGRTVVSSQADMVEANPTICVSFGTTNMIKTIMSEDTIRKLYAENFLINRFAPEENFGETKLGDGMAGGGYRHSDAAGSKDASLPGTLSESTVNKFTVELARKVIITADYNGVIRVFVKGF